MNNYKHPGYYTVNSGATNKPNNTWGLLFVITMNGSYNANYITQFYLGMNESSPTIAIRCYNNSNWNSWRKI